MPLIRSTKALVILLLAACPEPVEPSTDAGLVVVDASVTEPDAGIDPDSGSLPPDAGDPVEDIGFGPVGDCIDDSECDDGIFCNGAETCTDGTCVANEPACETRGCLSSCDEINDQCFDELIPQSYLCDDIHCAVASCDNRGRCTYESRPEYTCRTNEMQPCESTYQCRDGFVRSPM